MTSRYQALIHFLRSVRTMQYFDIGSILKEIKEGELYRTEIGDGINSWHDFVSMPEVGMTVNEANYLIKLFEMGSNSNVDIRTIPPRSLKLLVNKDYDEEKLHEAATLTTKDLKERLYDKEVGDESRTYEYLIMKRCNETGSLSKVQGVESEEVKQVFKEKIYE